jgi:hypothetical protein
MFASKRVSFDAIVRACDMGRGTSAGTVGIEPRDAYRLLTNCVHSRWTHLLRMAPLDDVFAEACISFDKLISQTLTRALFGLDLDTELATYPAPLRAQLLLDTSCGGMGLRSTFVTVIAAQLAALEAVHQPTIAHLQIQNAHRSRGC